jgi:hypothetical protein
MQFYTGFSLVDITATGVTRFRPEQEFERDQQRNWETVLQALGLRAQPLMITGPVSFTENVNNGTWHFGELYEGEQKIWAWSFGVEHEDIFLLGDDPMGALLKDFEQVPVVTGLTETARFMLPIFYPYGAIKNIEFVQGQFVR